MLELRDLKKRFDDVVALDGCSFRVERGRVLGFLGRNGAGKTTAMRGIFGLVQLDAGEVLWDGRRVGARERKRFGYMPEERGLYPRMRIGELLTYIGELRGLERGTAAAQAGLWLERLDLGDRAAGKLESLSHGNQQKVQLAVSLVGEPELLVLDEPFSGLDPIASETLSRTIREQAAAGTAVVFSSHQLDLVEDVCDDIAIITRGRTVLSGDLARIKAEAPVRYVDVTYSASFDGMRPEAIAGRVNGSRLLENGERNLRLQVPAATDPAAVLELIGGPGRIEHFRFDPPSLADIFHEAVSV